MADTPKESGPPSPKPAPPKESLWILERADNLLREISIALWLSIASIWRVPIAALADDSESRMPRLVVERRILPPRLGLLIASVAASLLLSWALPSRTPHLSASAQWTRLSSASPESWLYVAAPALIAIWMTVFVFGGVLRLIAGWRRSQPTDLLMHVAGATILICALATFSVWYWEDPIDSLREGLSDELLIYGTWVVTIVLAIAGFLAASQVTAATTPARWRRAALHLVAPLLYASTVTVATAGTYKLIQFHAMTLSDFATARLPEYPSPFSPDCSAKDDVVVCRMLLISKETIAVGALDKVRMEWRNSRFADSEEWTASAGQVTQTFPSVSSAGFWMLKANEPQPYAFQLSKAEACKMRGKMGPAGETVAPTDFFLDFYWRPGCALLPRADAMQEFGTVTEHFEDPQFEAELADLCAR